MKIVGIIAEYNPFHNGHAYQIEEIRRRTGADYIIIAMSGDFVQRGAPAIVDKYVRTKMALSCCADLVIELPVLWAASSAESFAMAGVTLFDKMGCVDALCFGAETDDLPFLSKIADILVEEPVEYKKALSSYIKEGLNFPTARAKAVCEFFSHSAASDCCCNSSTEMPASRSEMNFDASSQLPENHFSEFLRGILNNPNNILAIEYLKALRRRGSSIRPLLLKREGAGYHEAEIRDISTSAASTEHTNTENAAAPIASATAIRNILLTGTALSALGQTMPACALSALAEYLSENPPVESDDFSSILGYLLLRSSADELAKIGDCNMDIANRLSKNRMDFCSFTQFCEQNKSHDVTYTRISRVLLHALLDFTNDEYSYFRELDYIPYLRVLGFRKDSAELFKTIKANSKIPLVTKLADADKVLSKDALALLEKDIFAADLYEQIKAQKQQTACFTCSKKTTPRSEYTREIVLL